MSGAAQRRAILSLQALPPLALFVLGLAIIWAPGRPAMVDIPQHAAQVAMLRDLVLGRSAWAADLRVDLATPYFLGYALALPLALAMSPLAAIKVVLTAAYAAFGLIGRAIGRELDAPAALDSYYLIPFFGIAWSYGFYPFLVAAPLGLGLIWTSLRYAREGGWRRGVLVSVLGLATLFSHAFVFLFAGAIGLGLLAIEARKPRRILARLWPFLPPLVACAALALPVGHNEAATVGHLGLAWDMGPPIVRAAMLLAGSFDAWTAPWAWAAGGLLFALPFLGGFRMPHGRREAWVIAGALAAVMLLAPFSVWATNYVYPRFALFAPPAYAWLFGGAPGPLAGRRLLAAWLAGLIGALALSLHLVEECAFARETRDFDTVLARADPGRRALSLIVDRRSDAAVNPLVYINFPQWYAAEKAGLVDPSFALYPHMIVRLAHPGAPPYGDAAFALAGGPKRLYPGLWRYVFVRGAVPAPLFAGSSTTVVAKAGSWTLLEIQSP